MEDNRLKKQNNPQIIFSWTAPLRAYKKRSVGVLRFYIALGSLLSLVAILFGDIILLFPIWAIFFLFYVLTITPSAMVVNTITKFGIETGENIYRWEGLSHFYFIKKFEFDILVIVSVPPFNRHIYLVVDSEKNKKNIIEALSKYIVYQENPNKTFTDRLIEWLTYLMPQEEDQAKLNPQPTKSASI